MVSFTETIINNWVVITFFVVSAIILFFILYLARRESIKEKLMKGGKK